MRKPRSSAIMPADKSRRDGLARTSAIVAAIPEVSRSKELRAADPPSTAGSWPRAPGEKATLEPRVGLGRGWSLGGG